MNELQFMQLLNSIKACKEARRWAEGKDFKTVWETCERGDWLLWLCGRMADKENWPTPKQVVLSACDVAETALKFVPNDEKRPAECILIVRAWANDKATLEQVEKARRASAASAYTAAYAAYYAAYYAASAAYYAASAASVAAYAAYAASNTSARQKSLQESANLVRKSLTEFVKNNF